MTEDREISGGQMDKEKVSEKDDQTISERDEKGRFTKGWSGGPGRGKSEERAKRVTIDDLIDLIEEAAVDGMIKSKDLKERLTAAKVGLKVAELKKPEDEKPLIPPVIQAWMDLEKMALAYDGWEGVVLRICQICTDCPKFPGRDNFPFDPLPGPSGSWSSGESRTEKQVKESFLYVRPTHGGKKTHQSD